MKRTLLTALALFFLSTSTFAQGIEDYLNQLTAGTDASDLSQAKKDQLKARLDSLKQLMADPETPPSIWWKALDVYICLFRYAESFEKGTPPEQTAMDTEFAEDIKANGFLEALKNEHNPFGLNSPVTLPQPPEGSCSVTLSVMGNAGERTAILNIIRAKINEAIPLVAEGIPSGGSYSWFLDPSGGFVPQDAAFDESSTQGLNVFLGKRRGTFDIFVTYLAPNSAKCGSSFRIVVRE